MTRPLMPERLEALCGILRRDYPLLATECDELVRGYRAGREAEEARAELEMKLAQAAEVHKTLLEGNLKLVVERAELEKKLADTVPRCTASFDSLDESRRCFLQAGHAGNHSALGISWGSHRGDICGAMKGLLICQLDEGHEGMHGAQGTMWGSDESDSRSRETLVPNGLEGTYLELASAAWHEIERAAKEGATLEQLRDALADFASGLNEFVESDDAKRAAERKLEDLRKRWS